MSGPVNDCNCCQGLTAQTPDEVTNRPGLSAIAYRVGTQSRFKQSMLAALSDTTRPALQGLKTRDDDDFSIALLDAAATMVDVLTFYQERIANESYLRTATERRSLLELARLIGYQLRPGVAASTFLAFSMDTSPGAPQTTTVDMGTKVQSIPGPNQTAQTYETVEKIQAFVGWNALTPATTERVIPSARSTEVYLKGVTTNLKPGDGLLFIGSEREQDPTSDHWDFRVVASVTPDSNGGFTHVSWTEGLGSRFAAPAQAPKVFALRQRAALFGYNAPDWRTMADSVKRNYLTPGGLYAEYFAGTDLANRKLTRIDQEVNFDWGIGSPDALIPDDNFSARWSGLLWSGSTGDYTFYTTSDDGVRLWVDGQLIIDNWTDHAATEDFGTISLEAGQFHELKLEYYEHTGTAQIVLSWSGPNQPKQIIPSSVLYPSPFASEWPRFNIAYSDSVPASLDTIYLDAIYGKIVPGGWLVMTTPAYVEVYSVVSIVDDSRSDFTLTAKTSKVKLSGENLSAQFSTHLRDAVVLGQSEFLDMAERPLRTFEANAPSAALPLDEGMLPPLEGGQITLAKFATGLESGHTLAIIGKLVRVNIVAAPQAGEIVPDAGGQFTANLGDSLQVVDSPVMQSDGRVRLHLMDKNGFTAVVTTNPSNVSLTSALKDDTLTGECVTLASVDATGTQLQLNAGLKNSYDRATVVINANVAHATHGETVTEILGSGDASQTFQQFTLKQSPLTYVSAANPSGVASTLLVRVNGLLWEEVPTLYGRGPQEHIFVTRRDDNSVTTAESGDGVTGACLPTGQNNVQAVYRKGIGLAGLVSAGQLTLLLTRPLGINSVTNPEDTTGAQDPESLADARTNAPLTVMTLDRAVSLEDYEDFSRAFAGIAKALATWIWANQTQRVFVTVAGPEGAEIKTDSDTYKYLLTALQQAGDPFVSLCVKSFQPAFFHFAGKVKIDPAYETDSVLAAVEQALRTQFSFDARDFGEPVFLSEVFAVVQAVPGVVALDVNKLYRADKAPTLEARLLAALPEMLSDGSFSAAELLTLDPAPLDELGVMS